MAPSDVLFRRQVYYDGGWGYYSETAFIIKWVITALIIVALFAFFVGGWLHAQRRLKKNLPPLRYHKFLVTRRQRAQYPHLFPPPNVVYHHAPYGHAPAMPLNNYPPPPPAYGEHDYVPPYSPPEGGSKVNPNQTYPAHELPGPSQPSATASHYR